MKKDDLSKLKHIGAARMKHLHAAGITRFKQLCDTPVEKLAAIDTIGEHYARLIKEAVTAHCSPTQTIDTAKTGEDKQLKRSKVDENFQKQVKLLRRRIKQTAEKLKPLGNKKYLAQYVDCKKKCKAVTVQLKKIASLEENVSKKGKKKISRKIVALNTALKNVGKKPKKKTYNRVSRELLTFSELLKKTGL